MKYGICRVGIAPLRAQNSDRAEQVSELLFGELISVLEVKPNWIFVQSDSDGYSGWCDPKQIFPISPSEFSDLSALEQHYIEEHLAAAKTASGEQLLLPKGCSIPFSKNAETQPNRLLELIHPESFSLFHSSENMNITEVACTYLNAPYRWGGKTPFGIDCSGLTQMTFRLCGIYLPRDASEQAQEGNTVNMISEAQAGDLLFFDNEEGTIIHTGILLEHQRIIHASGFVRIDPIDHFGIFNQESQKYSHKLRLIKRI